MRKRAEIARDGRGAVARLSGVLRDATGDWTAAVFLDAGLILGSFLLLCFVRERKAASPASAPR